MVLEDELIELAHSCDVEICQTAVQLAKLSLLDWIVCGVAGADQPLSQKLREMARREASTGAAALFGGGTATPRMAALINGAASHALDYDDTHFAHVGHLSVAVFPATFAVAQERNLSTSDLINAFTVGAESAIRVGVALGSDHYDKGFHQTATAGAFGATIAAGRLYGLDEQQFRHALGLCSTRSSGLKSQFGTMGKPYNAGIASANGVEAALLAHLGFSSCENGLSGLQGFMETHTEVIDSSNSTQRPDAYFFCDNKYKLHACCHGLHAAIEALSKLTETGVGLNNVQHLTIETNHRWLRVCDKKTPKTGLEVKFSYAWLAGMVLRGDDTSNDKIYTDELANDPELTAFSKKTNVTGSDRLTELEVRGEVYLSSGDTIPFYFDLAATIEQHTLAKRLRKKAISLLGEQGAEIWNHHAEIDDVGLSAIAGFVQSTR